MDASESDLQRAIDTICRATGWGVGEAWVPAPDRDVLVCSPAWQAQHTADVRAFREATEPLQFAPGEGLPGAAWQQDRPVWMEDVSRDPAFVRSELAQALGLRTGVAIPVRADDEIVAVLTFLWNERKDRDNGLAALVEAVADELGGAMARRRAEAQLRVVLETAHDAVITIDDQHRITLFNRAAERLFGFSADEVIGQSVELLIPERLREGHRRGLESFAGSDQQGRVLKSPAMRGLRRDGSEFPMSASISQTALNSDEIFTIVLRDVTDQRRHERELREAKAQAEEMLQLKEALLSNMSHELRTPLASIMGLAEILEDEVAPEHRPLVQTIHSSGQRLLSAIETVLDLAVLESDAVELQPVEVDVVERVREVVARVERRARANGLAITIASDLPVSEAVLDREVLERVVGHLVDNAIKFTPSGHVTVELSRNDGSITLRVRDTGVGISKDFLPKAFDAFQQESSGPSRQFEGSGLGLTVVRQFVERVGGQVEIESTKGVGTTATVRMPAPVPGHATS